jgi:hypothetical protein
MTVLVGMSGGSDCRRFINTQFRPRARTPTRAGHKAALESRQDKRLFSIEWPKLLRPADL